MSQTTDNVSDMEDDNVSVAQARSVTSQQLQRSPISPGGSPSVKRTKSSPDPALIVKEAIQWLLHYLNLEMTRKTHMEMDVTRSLLVKLDALNTSVHDLLMANLELESKLEESRFTVEKCIKTVTAHCTVCRGVTVTRHDP